MNFSDWLKDKLDTHGLNSQSLADAIGENQPTIYRILSGETQNPRYKIVKKIEDYFNKQNTICNEHLVTSNARPKQDKRGILIEHYDAEGAMGQGIVLKDQSGVIREWAVSEEWVRLNIKNYTSLSNLKIVTGFGDSMKGLFSSGDPVVIDIGVKSVDFDSAYFFRVGNEGFIKRLQRVPGVGLRAISANKEYESWTITEHMDFEVFGIVLKSWQSVEFN